MRKDLEDRKTWLLHVHVAGRMTWDELYFDALKDEDETLWETGAVMMDREEVFEFILSAGRIEARLKRNQAWTEEDAGLWDTLTFINKCEVLLPAFPFDEYGY